MRLLLILLLAAMAGCASMPKEAKEADPHIFTLSDGQLKQCSEQGGCVILTRHKAIKMMKEVADEALAGCGVGS